MKGLKDDSPYDSSIDSKEGRRNAFSLSDRRLKKKKKKKKERREVERYTTLGGGNTSRWRIFVCPGSSCTDSSRVRGREAQRTMDEKGVERGWERESPRGPNLHPAKQPRTTLFDWLPAGLPSTPAPKYIPVFLLHSFIRLPSSPHRRLSPSPSVSSFSFLYYYILSSSSPYIPLFRCL